MMEITLKAVLCISFSGLVISDRPFPPSGPKLGESGKYVYTDQSGAFKHCLYCPRDAFESTEKNEAMQEPRCVGHYGNIKEEVTPYELETEKIPVCKIGEPPGCGSPPEVKETTDYDMYCDPGYSNKPYSVYFSCLFINKLTKVVTWSYYCNESLVWVVDSSMPVDPETVSPTHKGDLLQVLLVATGVVGALLVALLVAMVTCICKKRKRHDRSEHFKVDPEASVTLMNGEPIRSESHPQTGNMTPTDGRLSGSDMAETSSADEKERKKRSSNERLLPYGEEKHSDTKGCQTDTLTNTRTVQSLQNSTDGHCTRAQNVYGHNTATNTSVRAEIQTSVISNSKTCQCPVYRYRNPSPEVNTCSTSQSVLEMKSVGYQEFPSDINNLDKGQNIEQSKDSSKERERPNPLGNIAVPMCTESGYFDDENDKRHNTELKRTVNESLTEYPECSGCEQIRHEHSDLNNRYNGSTEPHTSQGTCTSSAFSSGAENGILPAHRPATYYQDIVDENQSFEIQPHQLLFH